MTKEQIIGMMYFANCEILVKTQDMLEKTLLYKRNLKHAANKIKPHIEAEVKGFYEFLDSDEVEIEWYKVVECIDKFIELFEKKDPSEITDILEAVLNNEYELQ